MLIDTSQVQAILVVGSDSVFLNGNPVSRSQYLIEPNQGVLVLFGRVPEFSLLRVTYRYLLVGRLKGEDNIWRLRKLTGENGDSILTVARLDTGHIQSVGDWQISGSKTVGLNIGTEAGVGIDQATRINLSGRVEDVKIDAEVSDQSSPIPPEGTTLELRELDRIKIDILGRKWRCNLGDVDIQTNVGSFGQVNRQAMGAVLTGSTGIFSGYLGYAQPRGEFGRVVLKGIDGVQGPYILAPDGRITQIVAGSEVVYLDGKRMTRGWDADYTIDYSTSEVVFTNRHIITSRSRIEAEFQFQTDAYERSGIAAGLRVTPNPFQVNLSFFQEGDNPRRLMNEDLTADQLLMLARLGRDTVNNWLSGAELVGEGMGDYVLEDGYFRFVGRNAGNYRVRFTYKGESLGSYFYDDSLNGFVYLGPGLGSYVDSIRIPLPKRDEIGYAQFGFEYDRLKASLEGVLRRRNVNLFAGDQAIDGTGAVGLGVDWIDSILGFSYQHRENGKGFFVAAQLPDVDFSYRWGGIKESLRRASDELVIRSFPRQNVQFQAEFGRLLKFDHTQINRYGAGAQIFWLELNGFKAGDFIFGQGRLAPNIRWFYPEIVVEQELKPLESHRSLRLGTEIKPKDDLVVGMSWQATGYQRRGTPDSFWENGDRTHLWQLTTNQRIREIFELSGVGGYQSYLYSAGGQNWGRYFASLNGGVRPISGLKVAFDLNHAYRQQQLKAEQFRYVGPHRGNYRYDSITGVYVSDPDGDYERIVVYLGSFARVRDFSLNTTFDWTGLELLYLFGSFSRDLSATDTSAMSCAENFNLRLDWNGWEPVVRPTLGIIGNRDLDRTLSITGRQSTQHIEFLELTSNQWQELEMFFRIERADLLRRFVSGTLDYQKSGWQFTVAPVIGAQLKLETGISWDRKAIVKPQWSEEIACFNLNAVEFWVAKNWVFFRQTRLRLRSGASYRWADVKSLPYEIALTRPLGFVPDFTAEVEQLFSDMFGLNARYFFTKQEGRLSTHNFSLQMRVYF